MAIKKNELYSSLWASCDKLRGGMDASQYKDYILTLLFVKYVTDKFKGVKYADITVPEGGGFDDMIALKGNKNIGEGMDVIIARLAEANDLRGVIDNARFNDEARHVRHFAILAGYEPSREQAEQISVNLQVAENTARLHDALKAGGYDGHNLEVYLVRLLFCFFAEDTGIFPAGSFQNLVENAQKDGSDLAGRLAKLFEILNTPEEELAKKTLLPQVFKQFRYVNGGLFADALPTADFNAPMRGTLLDCCDFDWSGISPAIFGAMFQEVMDAQARHELGAHYTSEENILKVIRPLFLDALWEEFERARVSEKALVEFHNKIARLHFLDPACGCGNFLIVAYRELRILELEILKMLLPAQHVLDIGLRLKVGVAQFAGMEIEDFPCQIARVGMWLMDHLMNLKAAEEFGQYFARLPLTASANIVHGNALEMDWNTVVPKEELSYIFGNPPFVGARMMVNDNKA